MTYTVTLIGCHGINSSDKREAIEVYTETLERVLGGAAKVESTYLAALAGLAGGRAWAYAEPLAAYCAFAGWKSVPPGAHFAIEAHTA